MPCNALKSAGRASPFATILNALGVRSHAQVIASVIQSIAVLVVNQSARASLHNLSRHVSRSWLSFFSWSLTAHRPQDLMFANLFLGLPTKLVQPFVVSIIHNRILSFGQWYRFHGEMIRLEKTYREREVSFRHGIGQFFAVFSGGRPAITGAHCEYQVAN